MTGPRASAVAGRFYPSDPEACRREIDRCVAAARPSLPPGTRAVAAIAPHAGWTYSGPTAALAVLALEPADTVLLFGADHHGLMGKVASAYPGDSWETPLGPVAVDVEVVAATGVQASEEAQAREHSLEVLVPLVAHHLPGARIVPILVPPEAGGAGVGEAAVRACQSLGRRAVALGSSDLTHYGPNYGRTEKGSGAEALLWSKRVNDREIIGRALSFDPVGIEETFLRRRNACGPGAMAATAAAAWALGSRKALLLEHTTSAEVTGDPNPTSWVGYASLVYLCK